MPAEKGRYWLTFSNRSSLRGKNTDDSDASETGKEFKTGAAVAEHCNDGCVIRENDVNDSQSKTSDRTTNCTANCTSNCTTENVNDDTA